MCHGIFPTGGNFSPILPINTGKPSQATGKKLFRNFLSLPKTNFRSEKKVGFKKNFGTKKYRSKPKLSV